MNKIIRGNLGFLLATFYSIAVLGAPPKLLKGLKLDARMRQSIKLRDFPGAIILAKKKGKWLVNKSWGETFYGSKLKPNAKFHLYDLASVTKAVAVSLSIMRLKDEGKINIKSTFDTYVPAAKGHPLGKLTLENMLCHRTGLPPYYFSNYWLLSKDLWHESSFSPIPTPAFPDPYRGKFLPKGYRKIMLEDLCRLPFEGKDKTVYSDLNYILLGYLIESVTGMRMDEYLAEWLVKPMELKHTTFNPLVNGFSQQQIVPTLDDKYHYGWVNDDEAAKLGGICGAAGLFASASDLMAIGEMILNGGTSAGKKYIEAATIKQFAWHLGPGYVRSMGWQKPSRNKNVKSIAPPQASPYAFGHTGYTGTMLWIDPQKDLVIVFLSNVTFPKDGISEFKQKAGFKNILKMIYEFS